MARMFADAAASVAVAQRHGSPVLMLAGDAPLGDAHNPQWFDQAALGRITTVEHGPSGVAASR